MHVTYHSIAIIPKLQVYKTIMPHCLYIEQFPQSRIYNF